MRSVIVGVVFVLCGVGIASAQPAPSTAPPAYPPPQGYPPPQPGYPPPQPGYPPAQPGYAPPPYAYQPRPQVVLTADEDELLRAGPISDGQYLGGGLAALFIGFGAGQAVEGRWRDTGWIFTLGETASIVALFWGFGEQIGDCLPVNAPNNCNSNRGVGLIVGGAIAVTGFRIGEVVDAFIAPPRHNQRLRELRMRLGMPQEPQYGLAPYVVPAGAGGGAVGGLSVRF